MEAKSFIDRDEFLKNLNLVDEVYKLHLKNEQVSKDDNQQQINRVDDEVGVLLGFDLGAMTELFAKIHERQRKLIEAEILKQKNNIVKQQGEILKKRRKLGKLMAWDLILKLEQESKSKLFV